MASPSIARAEPKLNLRGLGRLVLLILAFLIVIGPHLVTKLLGFRTALPNFFLGLGACAVGLDIEVRGAPLKRDVLFVANHVSWMDILALGWAGRTAFVSKSEVANWPVIGWLADQNRTIYIERGNRRTVGHQANALREALDQGYPVALFPEGTTGPGDDLLPFRPALLAAAAPGPDHLRIQPVVLDYGPVSQEFSWTDDEPTADNAVRLLSRKRRKRLVIHFLPPLADDIADNRKTAAKAAQDAIQSVLSDAQARPMRGRGEAL